MIRRHKFNYRLYRLTAIAFALSLLGCMRPILSSEASLSEQLITAMTQGTLADVEDLIRRGANVNARGGTLNRPALMEAAVMGTFPMLDAVLRANPDVDAVNNNGETALMKAVYAIEGLEKVNALLRAGAKVNIRDTKGQTALMHAAYWAKPQIIEALSEAGADVSTVNDNGETAIIKAVTGFYKHEDDHDRLKEVVSLLLEKLAPPPTEAEMQQRQLPEHVQGIIRNLIPSYLEKLKTAVVARAKILDQQGIHKDLIMLTLEQSYGPYVKDPEIRNAVSDALSI